MKNFLLNNIINQVMDDFAPCVYNIEFMMASTKNLDYTFKPIVIDSLRIGQNFTSKICDDITISFKLSYKDYAIMFSNMANLVGTLIFKYIDSGGKKIIKSAIIKKYRVILINPIDITKNVPDAMLRDTVDTEVTLRLIEPVVYDTRLKKINTIFTSTTVEDAIKHASVVFGLETIDMVKPDNTFVFETMIVPPGIGFSEFYLYIQEKFGVYMQGLSYYVQDGVLRVYAPFDLNPKMNKQLMVYQADIGGYEGASSYYSQVGDILSVVTNSVGNVFDLSALSSENSGTNRTFLRASSLINGVLHRDENNEPVFNQNDVLKVSLKNPNSYSVEGNNTTYDPVSTDNMFKLSSQLSSQQATMLEFVWKRSVPFSIIPGMKVSYYSDKNGLLSKQVGVVESVVTQILETDHTTQQNFVCMSNVSLRLVSEDNQNPNVTSYDKPSSSMVTVSQLLNPQ